MVITLEPDPEAALNEATVRQGVAPERLVANTLRQRFLNIAAPAVADDEWERGLYGMTRECGVSLPDSPLSRQELYE